jgi:DNA-binding HxlR family transcriptional regulator
MVGIKTGCSRRLGYPLKSVQLKIVQSARMLCEHLQKLEAEEILERNVYAETPVRIEYQLTAKGLSLRTVLVALGKWAIKWDGR